MSDPHSPRPQTRDIELNRRSEEGREAYLQGYEAGQRAAIRSAGTPPASRGMDDRLVRSLTKWLQQSGWVRDYEHARAESEGFANAFADSFPATPPEPVGGREALLAFVEHRLGLYVIAAEKLGLTAEQAMAVIEERDPYLAAALQASPPTGVSDGVALDVDALGVAIDIVGELNGPLLSFDAPDVAREYIRQLTVRLGKAD